jgi:hypothetical protein
MLPFTPQQPVDQYLMDHPSMHLSTFLSSSTSLKSLRRDLIQRLTQLETSTKRTYLGLLKSPHASLDITITFLQQQPRKLLIQLRPPPNLRNNK